MPRAHVAFHEDAGPGVAHPTAERKAAYLRSGSCPTLHWCLDAADAAESGDGTPGSDPAAEWSTSEALGAPRPAPGRPARTMRRSEALRQISEVAERHRCAGEYHTHGVEKHSKSSPNLVTAAANKEAARQKISSSPSCKCYASYASCMGLLQQFAGALSGGKRGKDSGAAAFDAPESSTVIFDWDDTLLPTSFLLGTVLPSLPKEDRNAELPRASPFWEALAAHAHVVGFVLRAARSVARVAIVTNSLSPWVVASGHRYLPGLDLEALLEELAVPVYYARRHVPGVRVNVTEEEHNIEIDRSLGARIGLNIVSGQDGSLQIVEIEDSGLVGKWNEENPSRRVLPGDRIVEVNGNREKLAEECRKKQAHKITLVREVSDVDPFTEAKRLDMEACLQRFYGEKARHQNVISIGDSITEHSALKQVLAGSPASSPSCRRLCKTVNLLGNPSVEQLSTELRILMVWLSRMVTYESDFDVAMDDLDELERKLFH